MREVFCSHTFEAGPQTVSERARPTDASAIAADGTATAAQDSSAGPLAGIRVIELGTLLAGPFACRLLADMGAEVIKVEAPGKPDPLRDWGRDRYQGHSLLWPVQARNKKCITLNLREPRGQELLLELVRRSDIVVENFRPQTLERWNLGFAEMALVNPAIILVRISGFGQTGPYAGRAGFASVAEAMGGLRYINGYPGETPPRNGVSLGDSLAAMFATIGALAALHRSKVDGGRGQVVDVSLVEACFALLEGAVPEYDRLGKVREPSGTSLTGIAPSNIFRSQDGRWVIIAANNDNLFRRLCQAMGQPELVDDERFATHAARGQHQEEIEGIVASWALAHSAATIDEVLNEAGVVCGPVYTIADIFADPQFQAREMLLEHFDESIGAFVGPGIVPKFSETPGGVRWSGTWEEGSHNEEILGDLLELDRGELTQLKSDGVV